jgi:hypothetical protein
VVVMATASSALRREWSPAGQNGPRMPWRDEVEAVLVCQSTPSEVTSQAALALAEPGSSAARCRTSSR